MEGHNVGLMVRTAATVLPPASTNPIIVIDSDDKTLTSLDGETTNVASTQAPCDCSAKSSRLNAGHKFSTAAQHMTGDDDNEDDSGNMEDDDATTDELQRINTNAATGPGNNN